MINTTTPDAFFDSLTQKEIDDQTQYWIKHTPNSIDEVFRRWLFAYTSIHTGWQGNVMGYQAIKDFIYWKWNKSELRKRLRKSGCGMHNMRTNYIWEFSKKFWANTSDYLPQAGESWRSYRDRLVQNNKGIGIAKVSYVLELMYPLTCKVLCGDIHQCRAYGFKTNLRDNGTDKHEYESMEYHWVQKSIAAGTSGPVARQIFWNRMKKQPNSRFWSWVFEEESFAITGGS